MNNKHEEMMIETETLIRSKRNIIYLVTQEENRVMSALELICSKAETKWDIIKWDIVSGLHSSYPEFMPKKESDVQLDQLEVLEWFEKLTVPKDKFCLLILKDYNKFFGTSNYRGQAENRCIRYMKNLSVKLNSHNKAIIIISNSFDIPNDLDKSLAILDWPLPEKNEIKNKITELLSHASKRKELADRFQTSYSEDEIEHIIQSFQGLTLAECEQTCAYCMIKHSKLQPEIISKHKKDIIRKSGLLDWVDSEINMDEIGGLEGLKNWLEKRKDAFSDEAAEYGLPANPKGILLVGIQGAGKSLFAKAISSFWNFPLLKLDMGKIFSGLVGSSEQNMRQVFKVAESVAPCILWCDEIDKGMSGSRSSSSSDGGTTSRVLGSWLTWMQDREAPVFVVATANDVSNLPPELLRKGRFDEIFFVDLPKDSERKKIFEIHLKKRNRNPSSFDIPSLVESSEFYTGAEIESSIEAAMYEAFSDNRRDILTEDILLSLNNTVPISRLMKEEINALRKWAADRARNASKSDKIVNRQKYEEDDL